MPDHNYRDDDQDLFNPSTHHESSDVPVRPLLWAVVIVIVFAIVTHIVLGFMYKGFVAAERKRMDPPETAVARPADADVPQNQPLLQPFPRQGGENSIVPPQASTPVVDMAQMRAAEDAGLHHYGWVDRQRGTVRIPIEQAKAVLAARLAVQGQLTGSTGTATITPPVTPGFEMSPAGTAVPPDTGVIPGPSTTTNPGTAPVTSAAPSPATPTSARPAPAPTATSGAGSTTGGTQR